MIGSSSMAAGSMIADNLRMSLNRHAQTLERVATGKRINSAKDDPAGLSMATKMSVSIRTADVLEKNLQNALSFLEVQDGVLAQMGEVLERIAELKALSDDVTKSSPDVALYEAEYLELREHLGSLSLEEFNGTRLFASSSTPDHLFVRNLDGNGSNQVSRSFSGDLFKGFTKSVYSVEGWNGITWTEAKADAEAKGGHLVTITSAEELAKISETIPATDPRNLWIGATDEDQEGVWEWVTGEAWDFTNWGSGNPSNSSGGEDYANKIRGTDRWNDWPNYRFNINGYILEKDAVFSPPELNSSIMPLAELDSSKISLSLQNIAQARAVNGAEQSRLRIASALNSTNKQNREAALGAIQDTDIAKASADLSKSKVFIQAGTALLAMQNVNSKSVLRLLE